MLIQEGKVYRDRQGHITGKIEFLNEEKYLHKYRDPSTGKQYTIYGCYLSEDVPSVCDLIEEVSVKDSFNDNKLAMLEEQEAAECDKLLIQEVETVVAKEETRYTFAFKFHFLSHVKISVFDPPMEGLVTSCIFDGQFKYTVRYVRDDLIVISDFYESELDLWS